MINDIAIPYGAYWSTPFAKWQKSFAHLHSLRFAAEVARREIARRGWQAGAIDHGVLGMTIPQWRSFFGVPWLMSRIGAPTVPGPTIAQACQTGPRCLYAAASEILTGGAAVSLVVTCDRASNAPFLTYPGDGGFGGRPEHESWVIDSFSDDPSLRIPMLRTAENCAVRYGITRQEQDELTLRRYEQYGEALASGFHRRFMTLPFEVPDRDFTRTVAVLEGDEGVTATSREAVERLKPVMEGGTVTYATQTHPADGNAAVLVTGRDRAREFSADPGIAIEILGFGQGRADPGYMPAAPVAAARRALDQAGVSLADVAVVKSHNPFVVNDIVFARETGYDAFAMNNFGSSLVFGHPQGPTGTRLIIEMIEELVGRGGGLGLYLGCAAGDSGAALVVRVSSAPSR